MLKKKKYAKHVADDEGPDWGGLKHVERPEGESDDSGKAVIIVPALTLYIHLTNVQFGLALISLLTDHEEKFICITIKCVAKLKVSQDS